MLPAVFVTIVPLPGRGHGFAVQPTTGRVAVFARRPGEWALVLDPATGDVLRLLSASAGRHFYGHGTFSPDGTLLYTSENRYEDGAGVIGVWDAARSWRRIREWSSGGVGPHEIRIFGNGTRLAVANGGIRTHPDTGRAKLNLDTMSSSLAVLDTADGRLARSAAFDARLRRLSIRHLDVDGDSRIVVAMQHEGSRQDRVPLVAYERDGRLVSAHAADDARRRMRQYAGSVSFDASGRYVAASHPHEGIVTLWATRPPRLLAVAELADTCGIARGIGAGEFIATGADGRIARIDARTERISGVGVLGGLALGQSYGGAGDFRVEGRSPGRLRPFHAIQTLRLGSTRRHQTPILSTSLVAAVRWLAISCNDRVSDLNAAPGLDQGDRS